MSKCALVAMTAVLAGCVATSGPSGLTLRQVWAGPEVDVMGAVTPDGRYLSFVDWETGHLAIRDLAAGKNRRLTNKGSWAHSSEYAEFSLPSPDGRQIAYAWHNREFFYELRVVGIDGSAPRVIYRREDMEYIQPAGWFPDGKRILAILSPSGKTNQIAVLAVADASAQVLRSFDWRYPRAVLSPDGRWIAYDFPPREDSEARDIFLLASDDARQTPLLVESSNDRVLGWAADGSRLLFARESAGQWDLWAMPMAAGKPQGPPVLVRADADPLSPLGITRAGAFYYGVTSSTSEVRMAALDAARGTGPEVMARLDAPAAAVAFSPDGGRLAYVSRPAGAGSRLRRLAIREIGTGKEREFTPRIRIGRGALLRWSPDGRSLLVAADDKRRRGLYRLDAESGQATELARSHAGDWSTDGQGIYFVRNDAATGSWHVVRRHGATGAEQELCRGGASGAEVASSVAASSDGWLLALLLGERGKPSAAVLKVMPSSGGEPRELLRVPEPEAIVAGSLAWTPDAREVLIARSKTSLHGRTTLWRIPVSGDAPRAVELSGAENLRSLSVHPGGRRVAFTTGVTQAQVWRMENWAALPLAHPPVP